MQLTPLRWEKNLFIADEKVRACALAKTGKESGITFIGDGRYDAAWSFEYEGQGRLCEVIVGDDGTVEIDPPAQWGLPGQGACTPRQPLNDLRRSRSPH
ncbi:hypothetical protein [Stenotrophomonas rhizophila]|uniref:hypothetical protein n=1 Tax=Stenotrophomonas rhizophila TaxID=216778 RepID=UPI001E56F4B1|nr:hypothetical protein [Stenotrophomonas rhizophila]MCC7635988.1 hypothetical protein [Stenotrophomonas rhizophila]MCC7665327.1 hypothetical protein [Stenotrophomonas rhizophila]